MTQLATFDRTSWKKETSSHEQQTAVCSLELGKVLFFPQLGFDLLPEELPLLTPEILGNRKNVSYDLAKDSLAAASCQGEKENTLKNMLRRFALSSKALIDLVLEPYSSTIKQGRTSFRPAEIAGRKSPSYRKDDTRLHVDAFPSSPTQGERILRVFANINREGKPRVWRLGEPFETVVEKILPLAKEPLFGISTLLYLLGITKKKRSLYDHYMLQIHDRMKESLSYQQSIAYEEILFPANTIWMVFTDQASHAALAGQHVLEQTFYLPAEGLQTPSTSPLKVLERYFERSLL
jgi:hypothetical protein